MRLILGLVVGGVEIVDSGLQAGFHDGEVLVGESHNDADVGAVPLEECRELLHIVGVHLVSDYAVAADPRSDRVAFALGA